MEGVWLTPGVPMACPRCTAAYPCHFSSQTEVSMPLDMPLSIDTNIEYEMDENKFPGLNSSNMELTLMIPEDCVDYSALPVVSSPLSSEDMQCSSGYVSEEEMATCLVDQGMDTFGIVSLIESLRETTESETSTSPQPNHTPEPEVNLDQTSCQVLPTALGDTLQEFLNSICQSQTACDAQPWTQCQQSMDFFQTSLVGSRDMSHDQEHFLNDGLDWTSDSSLQMDTSYQTVFTSAGQWGSFQPNPIHA